ncbi:hypothetical protein AVEN_207782-1 [Araneus ventricosus]|uniref:Uncharacterized protein n=1 Tax=Araneus ventricosus TaxID=182803 RepID=A0A4Y2BWR0_ARAVE|nr:hypothetical protein AVEN_207782-1 [Araneus ventricosus]
MILMIKNALVALLHKDSYQMLAKLAKSLVVDHTTVSKHLKALGMIQKQCHWVPYQLKGRDVERRLFTYEQLLQWQERDGVRALWSNEALAAVEC